MSSASAQKTDSALRDHALAAREAARGLAASAGDVRDAGLEAIAVALESERDAILQANAQDHAAAQQMHCPYCQHQMAVPAQQPSAPASPSSPAPETSEVVSTGMFATAQCQNPDAVGASGS